MSRYHDKWYTRLFSDPRIVEDLLRSFVNEDFVKELDFTTIKKLNTKFIPVSEKFHHADVVFEIKSHGQSAYIYLFLEFQSTVDDSCHYEWDGTYWSSMKRSKNLLKALH